MKSQDVANVECAKSKNFGKLQSQLEAQIGARRARHTPTPKRCATRAGRLNTATSRARSSVDSMMVLRPRRHPVRNRLAAGGKPASNSRSHLSEKLREIGFAGLR